MKGVSGEFAAHQLYAAHLNETVALVRVKARSFSVQKNLAHGN
jgi:hypothetical protein